MGAAILFTVRLNPDSTNGNGPSPNGLIPETTPVIPDAMPGPVTVASPQGTRPTTPLAAFAKLVLVIAGPGNCTVRAKLTLNPAALAVTTTEPAVVPAVTLI